MIQTWIFFLLPLVVWAVVEHQDKECSKPGMFVLYIPVGGALLGVSYCWGRYYANKLDYARTINQLLETSDSPDPHAHASAISTRMVDDFEISSRHTMLRSAAPDSHDELVFGSNEAENLRSSLNSQSEEEKAGSQATE
uniref:Uncharacterized protein n=1 Tax=Favella ehrenbergii TaxID=182087 RepID=A0A7S3I6Z1_9SPIT|mmetsp:Transcript_4562/g.5643  ORF Transcript_4562/g.5643 Transcript_4562/m.5643 type:complete len:139 (+) Transcript_4562:69-485(+)